MKASVASSSKTLKHLNCPETILQKIQSLPVFIVSPHISAEKELHLTVAFLPAQNLAATRKRKLGTTPLARFLRILRARRRRRQGRFVVGFFSNQLSAFDLSIAGTAI
jgi:hypothetical protein